MILHPAAFQRARPAGFDGVFHWDFLRPAWAPTKIQPMDIDAVVERHGLFLNFETKAPGVPIPDAQVLALERLILLGRGAVTTIALKAKHPEEIEGWEVWWLASNGRIKRRSYAGSADDLTAFCRRWFARASMAPPPIWTPKTRADLFNDLVSDPVEAATLALERLSPIELVRVFGRFASQWSVE